MEKVDDIEGVILVQGNNPEKERQFWDWVERYGSCRRPKGSRNGTTGVLTSWVQVQVFLGI
jgi:hypothetical protein